MSQNAECFVYRGKVPFTLAKWKVKSGNHVSVNTVVLTYTVDGGNAEMKLKSDVKGTVETLLVKEGEIVQPGENLLRLKSCTHEVIMKELCAQCGADLRQLSRQNLQEVVASRQFSMVHIVPELRCSLEQAKQLDQADEIRLLKARKLILLVDLDQTLIHTTNENVPLNLKDVHHFQLYGGHSQWYHTRLRPNTKKFLEKISESYELHIFTFGARMYSHKIASILDPDGKLFSHRILSRDECFDSTSKTGNLKTMFPRGDRMVCIIDDREDVWNFAPNVVHVKPYIYFRNTGDINAPPNGQQHTVVNPLQDNKAEVPQEKEPANNEITEPQEVSAEDDKKPDNEVEEVANNKEAKPENNVSQKEVDDGDDAEKPNEKEIIDGQSVKGITSSLCDGVVDEDDDDDDDYLLYLEDILLTIHQAYYDIYDELANQDTTTVPDLKSIIPYVRHKVLRGVNIVFSGVIPTNMAPEKSSLWILAKSLGASVSTELVLEDTNKKTTHIIASKVGTAKLNKARKRGNIKVVTPSWLICCATRWEKADERLFPLKKNGSSSPGVSRKHKKFGKSKGLTITEQDVVEEAGKVKRIKYLKEYPEGHSSSNVLDFSSQELEMMGKEVMEACEESDDSNDSTLKEHEYFHERSHGESTESAHGSSETSQQNMEQSNMDNESSNNSSGSLSSDNEEMASALERELFDSIPNS